MNYEETLASALQRLHDEGSLSHVHRHRAPEGGLPPCRLAPGRTGRNGRSRYGAATITSAWASTPPCSRRCTRPSTPPARRSGGAHATSPAPRSTTTVSRRSLRTCTARKARFSSPRPTSPTDATLSTLPKLFPGLIIYSDALNHASMIEGIRSQQTGRSASSGTTTSLICARFSRPTTPAAPKLIAFESIYSMDGDIAPIEAICDLALEFGALTYLDEVHAVGM